MGFSHQGDETAQEGGRAEKEMTKALLPELTKFEMNRLAHARAQEVHLPHSKPGQSGHSHLSQAALIHYGKKSWSDLSVEEMKKIYEFLDEKRRMPKRGEL